MFSHLLSEIGSDKISREKMFSQHFQLGQDAKVAKNLVRKFITKRFPTPSFKTLLRATISSKLTPSSAFPEYCPSLPAQPQHLQEVRLLGSVSVVTGREQSSLEGSGGLSVGSRLVTESQNHRMVGVGRDLCGSSSPTLLPKQGHLQQAAQDLV